MSQVLDVLAQAWDILRVLIQIGLLATLIYFALRYMRNTPAAMILAGIAILVIFAWVLSQLLGLEVIEWMLSRMPTFLVLAVLIIFQPELRRALAALGSNPNRLMVAEEERVEDTIAALESAAFALAKRRLGAIIAVERTIGMRSYIEQGVKVNAPISAELLVTMFYKDTPLHDGAVIIRNGIIQAAGCVFPLSQSTLDQELGTRHRAAVGISEETDAVVIVCSEERGEVSLAHRGRLVRNVDAGRLRRHLNNYLLKSVQQTLH